MLWSLLKDLLAAQRPRPPFEDMEALPYHDPQQLALAVSRKAGFLGQHGYLRWPAMVHMETIAVCNAACDFCPYPTLERQGARMPDAMIEKIIRDLGDIPPHVTFQLAPYKVSDPLLEPRLFDILELVNARLPDARISIITNGAALTERNIDALCAVKNILYLSISVNYDNAEEYEAVMKIPFARTVKRLDLLHEMGKIQLPRLQPAHHAAQRLARAGGDRHGHFRSAGRSLPSLVRYVHHRHRQGRDVLHGRRGKISEGRCHSNALAGYLQSAAPAAFPRATHKPAQCRRSL